MSKVRKQLSNPISTGGLGTHFENRVQTSFAILMLTGGVSPCLCSWPIIKIKLQGRYKGFETDDLIVYSEQPDTGKQVKLLGQIKHSISITNGNKEFREVIQAAWNDFNNKNIFNEGTDVIALICGPLSATDTNDVRQLLKQARSSEDPVDFITRINLAKFTSENQRKKLKIFKSQLKSANRNIELTDDLLWRFLKSFHLLIYDLDIEGVTQSLLHSLIEQHSRNNANAIWAEIKDHVEQENENAGCITVDSIPEEIRCKFKTVPVEVIPEDFVKNTEVLIMDWNRHIYSRELAIASILGSWNENTEADKVIVSKLAREEYKNWILKLREVLQEPESPIILKNGIWSIKDRKKLWKSLESRIFDEDLDNFHKCVVSVLTELDSKFELSEEQRFSASIYGKVLKFSSSLRKGLAESLALLGCCSTTLTHCSLNKAEHTVILSVREIFNNSVWILWASLNDLLPTIAESAPDEFLKAVETTLRQAPCPFLKIFPQKETGVMGSNYIVGLLWALESLAWEENFLVHVTIILGELACIDPGSNWSNRPSNSLIKIFLPWLPQTTATQEKRKVAIKILNNEIPDVAWKLLINLLPNKHLTSSGSCKPVWRNSIPEDFSDKVTNKEYKEQILFYTDFAVEQAKDNIDRLKMLVREFDHLSKPAFDKILDYLSSETIITKSEDIKMGLWSALIDFASKHERYSDAKWALDSALVSRIKEVANKLEPKNPINLYSRLFNGRDYDLFEEKGDWQAQARKLEDKRQKALKIIIEKGGIDAVFQFLEIVESSANVGNSLGNIADDSFDKIILPKLLIIDNKKFEEFISYYVSSRHRKQGWEWVDYTGIKEWSASQIARFFMCLPFTTATWEQISKIFPDAEPEYWKKVNVNPYQSDVDLDFAIDKLIKYNRPCAAIDCIYKNIYDKQPLDKKKTVQALTLAISSSEPKQSMDTYHVLEIIKLLQDDSTISDDDRLRIEWAYLPLLDGEQGARPEFIENRLATNPNFFCEIIRLAYRSKNISEKPQEISEERKTIAVNAWELLHRWNTPPGLQDGGIFDNKKFTTWLEETKKSCTESGHLDIALSIIGKVLLYCPSDTDGFWLNKVVASTLNEKDSEEMREGFCTEIYNSRAVHWVDPTGKPEKELASKYKQQADDAENAGYQRLATALKSIADSYEREAAKIIDEHKLENKEK